ncbi:MAG: trypsin-like peptidase domain-containing protein [Caldilineales bacterium]|nr:trypsin-like peptidase domain-containing protein [Caldilineales bacterium]MDW8319356.1 trypsin-like peptidase domain-containing protein [Anaerolineae bacterium]
MSTRTVFLLLGIALLSFAAVALAALALASTAAAAPPPQGPVQPEGPRPLAQVQVVAMPALDNQALLAAELQRRGPGIAPRFAHAVPVRLTPDTAGTWDRLADGRWLWRLRVRSAGAVSLNLGFTQYRMPAGGRLAVYTLDRSAEFVFTDADNEAHGQLWTPLLPGDEVVVEATLPAEARSALQLELAAVNHGFTDLKSVLQSGSCNVDVVCGAADGFPQVDLWRDQMRAVARLVIGGNTACTGFLVNNTANDGKPYLMTAAHCGVGPATAPSLVAYWNFYNSFCRPPNTPGAGGRGNGSLSQFNTGSFWRAGYGVSDFTLVELDDPIHPAHQPFWAGWDARNLAPASAVTIHHPRAEEMRISFENDPLTVTSYLGSTSPGDGTHLRVADWDLGTTEPGSSGSPLFSPEGRVVGQLHGGFAACGNDAADWYGRFAASWTGGGTPTSRLRDWLDPLGLGVQVWNGFGGRPDFTLRVTPREQGACLPASAAYSVTVQAIGGFTETVTLSAVNLPAGVSPAFSLNPVPPDQTSRLTLGTAGAAPGRYTFELVGAAASLVHTATVGLNLAASTFGPPTLISPADGATGLDPMPTFQWQAVPGATGYELQIATDAGFADIVYAATVPAAQTSAQIGEPLARGTTHFWRMAVHNPCGRGPFSPARRFTTQYPPGQCPVGAQLVTLFADDFESGAAGWTSEGSGNTWALWSQRVRSGAFAYHADTPSTVTDQRLASPAIPLPATELPIYLSFWNYQHMESRGSGGCFDGGLLEVSTNGGATWQQVEAGLLTDPYDGPISSGFNNPLAGRPAWCGDPQDWLESIVDLAPYAGRTIRLRFRVGTDSSVRREGWTIDDVVVQACQVGGPRIVVDPSALASSQSPGSAVQQVLHIRNEGQTPLTWRIAEEPAAAHRAAVALAVPAGSPERLSPAAAPRSRSAPLIPAEDVINDGSFEAGTPNPFWGESSVAFGSPLCSRTTCNPNVGSGPRTGAWWAWFGGVARVRETASLTQTVVLHPGAPAELSFWLEMPTAQAPATLTVSLDNTVLFQATAADASRYATYTRVRADVGAFADGRPHALRFHAVTASNGAAVTNIFVDDVALNDNLVPPCSRLEDVPWLSVFPTQGTLEPFGAGSKAAVAATVTFDASGLNLGLYRAHLCVTSNDRDNPLVVVPVRMEVFRHPVRTYLPLLLRGP